MRIRFTPTVSGVLFLMAITGQVAMAATPRIVALSPPDGADDVDPGLTTLEIKFDQGVFSGAGGVCFDTPGKPSPITRVGWKASNVFSVTVRLEPDTVYEFTIGCPENQRFQSMEGEVIEPAKWRFATRGWAPPEQQRAINEAALDEAKQMLKDFFVHLDRRGIDLVGDRGKLLGRLACVGDEGLELVGVVRKARGELAHVLDRLAHRIRTDHVEAFLQRCRQGLEFRTQRIEPARHGCRVIHE